MFVDASMTQQMPQPIPKDDVLARIAAALETMATSAASQASTQLALSTQLSALLASTAQQSQPREHQGFQDKPDAAAKS